MKIGIIGAMEVEGESLKNEMEVTRTVKKASMEFFEGKTKDKIIAAIKEDREAKITKYNAQLETL